MIEKGTTVQVLDQGYVKLIDWMGSDESIVEAARMSTGKGFISWDPYQVCKNCGLVTTNDESLTCPHGGELRTHNWEKYPNGDMGLLDTLWRKKHATPFEMCEMVVEAQAPIMVFREWHRHRTQSYNEFSARNAQMPNIHYLPSTERIQKQSAHNKQGSAEAFPEEYANMVRQRLDEQQQDIYIYYDSLVEGGVAKEVARLNTPVARYSKHRAKTNLRNWFLFANLRHRPDAQWEIRQYCEIIGNFLKELFPRSWGLFEEYDLYGAHFSRTELMFLRHWIADLEHQISPGGEVAIPLSAALKGKKREEFLDKVFNGGEKILA